jgi:hypothetical protein
MGADALIVLSGLRPGAPIRVEVSGPMALDGMLTDLSADLDGAPAEIVPLETAGSGWALELEFPEREKGAPSAAFLRLRAPARQPSPADRRLLSLAVSEVLVDQAFDDDALLDALADGEGELDVPAATEDDKSIGDDSAAAAVVSEARSQAKKGRGKAAKELS